MLIRIGPAWPNCDGSDGDPNVAGDCYAGVDGDDQPIQFDYIEQEHDHLRRSWAQRMVFGMINAYRAVAHTIPLKTDQRFTRSQTVAFDDVVRGPLGQQVMHMGAWYREGTREDVNNNSVNGEALDLYVAGGASLTGEIHNNQGAKELNGSGIVLTAPDDATLATDGIITMDSPTGGFKITQLFNRQFAAGPQSLRLETGMLSGGIYALRIETQDRLETKMLRVKR